MYSHETGYCLSCLLREPEQYKCRIFFVPVNKVIFSLDHAGKRPLACDWSCIYSCRHRISMKIGGRNTKSRLSLPFSFSRFSPLCLPFLHLPHWLFSLALLFASILSCFLLPWLVPERNYFRKPWDFFSFPKINFVKSWKISTRQGFKKNKPFVRVTPAQTQPTLR